MSKETPKYEKAEWIGASKKSLFDKHNALVEKLNSEVVTTTADVIAGRESATTVATADSIVTDLDAIGTRFDSAMAAIRTMSDQYQNLNAAISTKRTELKDILGFEVEANSTIALVTAKDAMLADKSAEAVTIIASAKADGKDIISAANQEVSDMQADQAKKKAEWEYDFAREKKAASDELTDELNVRIKAVDERVADVSAREDLADELDARVKALEAELLETQESIVTQIASAVEANTESIAKAAAISKSYSDRAHKQDLEMKDVSIEGLTEKVTDLNGQLLKSTELIANANSNVAEMAKSALTAHGDAATIAKVAEVAAGSGNGKNR